MLPASSGWINHTETLLFCVSAGENIECLMQQFFHIKVILILHLICILL